MKRWLIIALAVVLVVTGLGYAFRDTVTSALRADDPAQLAAGEALTVTPVGRGNIARYLTASGNLQPGRSVDLRFRTSGRVEEIYVNIGDRVSEGDELLRLDNRQQELAYLQAKTNYEIARIDAAPNAIQEREYDMELALDTLEGTILRAPFDGLITDVLVEPGASVGTTDIVIQMIDDSVYKVDVTIDELDIGQVAVGQQAIITLDADRNRPRTGLVERIGFVATVQSGMVTIPVTVRLDQVDPFLRPGYTATVQIAVAAASNVVRIPVEAINNSSGPDMVTKVVDGERVPVMIQTGVTDGVWVEVVSGLEEGDEIVGLNYRGGPPTGMMPGQGGSRGFGGAISIPGGSVIRR